METDQQIRECQVSPGHIALWWLGQASFILKSPQGVTIAIDPYLTNSCKETAGASPLDVDRLFPSPIFPERLKVSAIALTHSHQDHCDPQTINGYRSAGGRGPYVATGETKDKLAALGVPEEEILLTWPNKEHRIGDVRLKATFAIPYGGDDLTHVGYLVFVDDGPGVYFTGDTDYHDLLGYVGDYKPEIMVTVINGAFHNLGPNEAAKLTAKINPKIVIPCHYDLFADNSLDPRLFRTCLHALGLADRYRVLEHGQTFIFPV
ncbi:MAG TPA: MBL fold metallo-hydrolase [Terriglobales bacterium]|nr:MBL fold metallo-hydrolase [Terriglobales bacterium]